MSAKTILTKAKLDKTIWGKRIIAAEKKGGFTARTVALSEDWNTCACGKQDNILKEHNATLDRLIPWDGELDSLGFGFYDTVSQDSFEHAAQYLIDIQKRSIHLLNIIKKYGLKKAKVMA